jgi:hypothetical protein
MKYQLSLLLVALAATGYPACARSPLDTLLSKLRTCDFVAFVTVVESGKFKRFTIDSQLKGDPARLGLYQGIASVLEPGDKVLLYSSSKGNEFSVSYVHFDKDRAIWSEEADCGRLLTREDSKELFMDAVQRMFPRKK